MKTSLFLSFFLIFGYLHATIQVSTDRPDAAYQAGETIIFRIQSNVTGPARYEIRYSNTGKVLEKADLNLTAWLVTEVHFTPQSPCFVVCMVSQFAQSAMAGASVSPFDLKPFEPEPPDFDIFWDGIKAQLAQVPIDPQLTFLFATAASTTYRINLAGLDNRRVYGYITIPNTTGPFAAVLQVPPYGAQPGNALPFDYAAENLGVIAMSISIHNAEPDTQDPNAYQPDEPANKNTNYYKYALTAAIRAIDYIYSRPDFNGSELALFGISQGGGLAISTAGLDSRVKLLIDVVPALCRHHGLRYGRPSGHPHYILNARQNNGDPAYEAAVTEATKYYDAVYFAKRYKGPSLSLFGYVDQTCPPATGFTANNNLLDAKIIVHSVKGGHGAFFAGLYDWYKFVRGYFTDLHPYDTPVQNTSWYQLNAGPDQSTTSGTPVNLQAVFSLEGTTSQDLPIRWEKVSGPGPVQFSSPYSYQTTVSFSQSGSYLLRAVVEDKSHLDQDQVWYDIVDYVWIHVQ